MNFQIPQIQKIRRVYARIFTLLRVLLICLCQRRVRLFVGDSHNNFLNEIDFKTKHRWNFSKSGDIVIWVGPKLMYSVGLYGLRFSRSEYMALKLLNISEAYFNFGEIDVRVHGAKLKNSTNIETLVRNYLSKVKLFSSKIGVKEFHVINLIPPSDLGTQNPEFPRNESLIFRIELTKSINYQLATQASKFTVIDQYTCLADAEGKLNSEYTSDGLHVNSMGATKVRRLFLL